LKDGKGERGGGGGGFFAYSLLVGYSCIGLYCFFGVKKPSSVT